MTEKKQTATETNGPDLRELEGQFQAFAIDTGAKIEQLRAEIHGNQTDDATAAVLPVRVRLALLESATSLYNAIPVKSSDPVTDYRRAALAALALLAAVDAES